MFDRWSALCLIPNSVEKKKQKQKTRACSSQGLKPITLILCVVYTSVDGTGL